MRRYCLRGVDGLRNRYSRPSTFPTISSLGYAVRPSRAYAITRRTVTNRGCDRNSGRAAPRISAVLWALSGSGELDGDPFHRASRDRYDDPRAVRRAPKLLGDAPESFS